MLSELDMLSEQFDCIEHYDQYSLYKLLIRRLSTERTAKKMTNSAAIQAIERFIEEHQGQLAPPLFRLCQWALEMYRNGSYTKARLAMSTIPKYLGQVQDLINHLGSLDPMQREGEDLLEVYQLMIDQTKTAQGKSYKAGRIKEFHHFLIKKGYLDILDLDDLIQGRAVGSKVDANYFTETEYRQTLLELTRIEMTNPRLQRIRRLILMLGYRCGLRRTEAWKLRMCDIQWTQYPVLFVVATQHKSVKSSSSTRQLPLQSLLTAEELMEFKTWYELRRAEEGLLGFETDQTFLFCYEHSAHSLVDEQQIFSVLHCVLRAVTGDKTIRFHHLRHSFANNLLVRAMGLLIPILQSAYQNYHSVARDRAEQGLTISLFELPLGTSSRKHLFQVSALLGHGGPDISLLHYIHLCDLMLRYSLNASRESLLPIETISTMANLSRDNLNKTRQRHYPGLSISDVARIKLRKSVAKKVAPSQEVALVSQDQLIEWPEAMVKSVMGQHNQEPSIALLHQVIANYHPIDKDADYWAAKIGFPASSLEKWINAGHYLAQMRTGKGTYRHFRPKWWGLQDECKKRQRIAQHSQASSHYMSRPHTQQDIDDCRQTIQGIQSLRWAIPELADFGVGYYLRHSVASRSDLRMQSPCDAEKFVEFIQACGFARKRIQCKLKPQMRMNHLSIEQQIDYWSNRLSIMPSQIRLGEPLKERGFDYGTLSLMLADKDSDGETLASYGFRYALYMMGILMLAGEEIEIE